MVEDRPGPSSTLPILRPRSSSSASNECTQFDRMLDSHVEELQAVRREFRQDFRELTAAVWRMEAVLGSQNPSKRRLISPFAKPPPQLAENGAVSTNDLAKHAIENSCAQPQPMNEALNAGSLSSPRPLIFGQSSPIDLKTLSLNTKRPVFDSVTLADSEVQADGAGEFDEEEVTKRSLSEIETQVSKAASKFFGDSNAHGQNSAVGRLVHSNFFESFCTLVIVANSIFLGYASEYAIGNPRDHVNDFIIYGNWCFAGFYILEIILRLVGQRYRFFFGEDWRWNLFDLLLVCTSCYNNISAWVSDSETSNSSNLMRMLRLMKMLKMLRMIRVMRFFRELRLMLLPIVQSLRSLFWTLCMLGIVMYIFGIVFLQAAAGALVSHADPVGFRMEEDTARDMYNYWGSVTTAMLTLYKAITGGDDWGQFAEPLKQAGVLYYVIFLFYIAFLTIAVLNIVTGIFVDTAMSYSEEDRDNVSMMEMTQDIYVDMVDDLIKAMDFDASGSLDYPEFAASVAKPEVTRLLDKHDIDPEEAKSLFWRLSQNGQSEVPINDFVRVFTRMKGAARSVDIQALAFDQKRLADSFAANMEACHASLATIARRLEDGS